MLIEKKSVETFKSYISFITDGEVVESRDYSLVEESKEYFRYVPLTRDAEFAWTLLKKATTESPALAAEFARDAHKSN